MLAIVMVISAMTSNTAYAVGEKVIAVSVKGAKTFGGKLNITAKKKYQITVKYAGKNVTNKATYKTSNKKIAIVTKKGKITALKQGSCTIKVKYKGKTKNIKLKVIKKTTHKHVWKAHKTTKQVWVPKIVTVDDYEFQEIHGARLYKYVDEKTSVGSDVIYWFENGYTEEDFEKFLTEKFIEQVTSGEELKPGDILYGGWCSAIKYKKVKTGSHTEDHGYYKTVPTNTTDYYTCSCGAKKLLSGVIVIEMP